MMACAAVRIAAVVGLLAVSLAAASTAHGQSASKLWRIGFVGAESESTSRHFLDAFRAGMIDQGYVEGRNIIIDVRWAEGRTERVRSLITDLIQHKSDVLVILSTQAALEAKALTKTIPIVFIAGDPVGSGLVSDLGHPGGNLTGLAITLGEEFLGKWLELLRQVVPKITRVAILFNPDNPVNTSRLQAVQDSARQLNIKLQQRGVTDAAQLDAAFTAMDAAHAEGLLVFLDPLTVRHRARIVELAATHRLPTVYGLREFVETGGLMAYGSNIPALCRRAALYVHKIIKGARPADLPVEQATQFELLINLKAARALGLTVPQSLLMRADQVLP